METEGKSESGSPSCAFALAGQQCKQEAGYRCRWGRCRGEQALVTQGQQRFAVWPQGAPLGERRTDTGSRVPGTEKPSTWVTYRGLPKLGAGRMRSVFSSQFCFLREKHGRLRARGVKGCWMFDGKGDSVKYCLRAGVDGPGAGGGQQNPLKVTAHPFLLRPAPPSVRSRVVPCSGARVSQGQLHFPSGDFPR